MKKKSIWLVVSVVVVLGLLIGGFGCAQEAAPAPGPAPTKTVTKTVETTVTATPAKPEFKEWKIGAIFAYTGAAASIFDVWRLTLDMQAEEFNAADVVKYGDTVYEEANEFGGVKIGDDYYKITVIHEDNAISIEKEVAAFRKLYYQDDVRHMITPGIPFLAAPIKSDIDELKVLTFDGTSVFDIVGPYGFKCKFSGDYGLTAVTKYVAENYPEAKRYAVLGPDDAGGHGAWDTVKKTVIDEMPGRFELIEPIFYDPETVEFSSILTGLLQQNPDIIDCSHSPKDPGLLIVKQARELGYKGIITSYYATTKDEMDAVVPKEYQYDILPSANLIWEYAPTQWLKDFYNRFVARWGQTPDPDTIHITDQLPIMVQAAIKAGTIDTTAMVKELESWKTVPYSLGDATWGGVETTGYAHALNARLPMIHIDAKGEWNCIISPVINVP